MADDTQKTTVRQPEPLVQNSVTEAAKEPGKAGFFNSLWSAVFGQGFPGQGYGFGGPGSQPSAQPTEIFQNLRWYFVSNMSQVLSEAYTEIGLIQVICNVPVEDGLRGGVDVESKQLSPEQLQQLRDVFTRQDDLHKVKMGLVWTRLFGGGGVIILTDQDPSQPLDITKIGPETPLEFRAVDMWELYFDTQNTGGTGGFDSIPQDETYDSYSYYGVKIHKSRVMKMVGMTAPSFLRPRLRGWGFSIVEGLVRSINQYLRGTDLIYELVNEAKLDVFGIKNLTNTLMMPQGTEQIHARIQLANRQKNFQNALVMDGEDSYEQKTMTFSGIADVMKEIRMQVAADLRMPLTKIFGISASGFNSGEDDIEIYNGMVESTVRSIAKKDILTILELRCQQLFGFIPDDLSIAFQPLRVMSAEQEQNVKEKQYNRLLQGFQAGALSLVEFRDACNKLNLVGVQLEDDQLPDGAEEVSGVEAGADEDGSDELGETKDSSKADKSEEKEDSDASLSGGDQPSTKD